MAIGPVQRVEIGLATLDEAAEMQILETGSPGSR